MAIEVLSPGASLDRLANDLDLTPEVLAGALQVTPRTLERWASEETIPQHAQRRLLKELSSLRDRLQWSLGSTKAVREWLHTDNAYLRYAKPVDLLARSRLDVVLAAITAYDEGISV